MVTIVTIVKTADFGVHYQSTILEGKPGGELLAAVSDQLSTVSIQVDRILEARSQEPVKVTRKRCEVLF